MGLGCVLMACEMIGCDEMIRKQVYESIDCGEDAVCKVCLRIINKCCYVMIDFRLRWSTFAAF